MKKLIIVFMLFLTSTFASVDFEYLISKAIESHPGVAMSKESLAAAAEGIEGAKWEYYPTPSVEVSRSSKNSLVTTSLKQPVWAGGKIDGNYNLAISRKNEASLEVDENKYNLIESILDLVYSYNQAELTELAQKEGLSRLLEFQEMIQRRFDAGVSSQADKFLLDSRLTQIKLDLINSKSRKEIALKQLSLMVSSDIDSISINSDKFKFDKSIAEYIDSMLIFNPTIQKIEQQIKSAIISAQVEQSSLFPVVSLTAEHTSGSVYYETSNNSNNVIYVSLKATPGAGLSLLSNIQKSKIRIQQLKFEKLNKEKELTEKFISEYNTMITAKDKVENLKINTILSKNVFESNKRMFISGKKQWLDLVNSSKELMDLELALNDARSSYAIMKYKIAFKIGNIDLNNGKTNSLKSAGDNFKTIQIINEDTKKSQTKDSNVSISLDSNMTTKTKNDLIEIISPQFYAWKNSWQDNDFKKYSSFYSKDFKWLNGSNINSFITYKKKLFDRNDKKTIDIKDLTITPYQNIENKNMFKIEFFQTYKSKRHKSSSNKELHVEVINNKIEILSEIEKSQTKDSNVSISLDSNMTTKTKNDLIEIISPQFYAWKNSWQDNDFKKYSSFYSKDFKWLNGSNINSFITYKKKLFDRNDKKTIDIKDLTITPYQNIENKNMFKIEFFQTYKSKRHKSSSNKELHVEVINNKIEILSEIEKSQTKDSNVSISLDSNMTTKTKNDLIEIISPQFYAWKNSWQDNDFKKYSSFYSKDFKWLNGSNINSFITYKKKLFDRNDKKTIDIKDLTITPYQNIENKNMFKIEFFQTYKSKRHKSSSNKELHVEVINNKIEILSEN